MWIQEIVNERAMPWISIQEKTKLKNKIEKRCHGQVDMLTTVRATERNRSRFLTKVVCTIAL
jgi:hypothetical protein